MGGYAGKLVTWVTTVLQRTLVIVKRPQRTQGFQVLQWRWTIERGHLYTPVQTTVPYPIIQWHSESLWLHFHLLGWLSKG